METVDCIVVGAGAVGLGVARTLATAGREVLVLEAEPRIGEHTSSRNSEVIHGGMYYPTGSLRAHHCPRGRRLLYEFCASHGVPHRKCGKLIVATEDAEIVKMEAILKQGLTNGVEGFAMIDGAEARKMEPALHCVAALHSPETGIVDSHQFMTALRGELLALDPGFHRVLEDAEIEVQAGGPVAFVDQHVPERERVLAPRDGDQHRLVLREHVVLPDRLANLIAEELEKVRSAERGVVTPELEDRRLPALAALHRGSD